MFDYLIIAWGGVLGLLLGGAMARAISRRIVREARQRAGAALEEARERSAERRRSMEAMAREEALALRTAGEEQERQISEENTLLEERVRKLEDRVERREADVARAGQEQDRRRSAVAGLRAEAKARREAAGEKRQAAVRLLEERAGETRVQLCDRLSDRLVEDHRAECADRLRNMEADDSEEFVRQAKRLIGISLGRHGGSIPTERQSFVVHLSGDEAKVLAEHPEYLALIEEQTGVRLAAAEGGETFRMESSDGVARELCRRTLSRLLGDKPVREPEKLVRTLSDELTRELKKRGLSAFRTLGLPPAHREIVDLVGRLYYRTSYTQNQWAHAIEAAFLAGLIASEMGLDVAVARRGTLLHDIGKALSHQIEGSHAVIGAELCRKHGEPEEVANAVGAHHADEPPTSPYAYLVAAADAMSGARPGARREMMETYVDRIGELERVAHRAKGVTTVHAVQAGREVRVHVDEHRVSDARAAELAEEIAGNISEEITFPGQIRVVVIREFRANEVAR